MTLLPDRSIHQRFVAHAEFRATKRGLPVVFVRFLTGDVIYLGPLDYYGVSVAALQVDKSVGDHFRMAEPFALFRHLPKDPSFLIGRCLELEVRHQTMGEGTPDARTYQGFRFRRLL